MMNFAQFDIATFNINLHNFASSVSISLRLYDNTLQKSIENPISGFPRVLTAALGKDPPGKFRYDCLRRRADPCTQQKSWSPRPRPILRASRTV